jgi:hypothetical protein
MSRTKYFFLVVIPVAVAYAGLVQLLQFSVKEKEQRSCVVVSTNITLIPAKPNTVTILRNGTKETCYIYKDDPVENKDAMSN